MINYVPRFFRRLPTIAATVLAVASVSVHAADGDDHSDGQQPENLIPDIEQAAKVNNNTIGIVFSPESEFLTAVQDLDGEVEEHSDLRIVPILGRNNVQNVYDLLFLKGVDVALVRNDSIEYVRRLGNFPTVRNVVNNLASIHSDKLALIANKSINSLSDLAGKKVSVGQFASSGYVSATLISSILGIEFENVYLDADDSAERLASGDIDAIFTVLEHHHDDHDDHGDEHEGEEEEGLLNFPPADNVHVVEMPINNDLLSVYNEDTLTNEELPSLIAEGEEVRTYSVDTVLAAYRWRKRNPRYAKTGRFVDAFLDTVDDLQEGDNQVFWGDMDIDKPVPSMNRLALVDEVLNERERRKEAVLQAMKERIAAQKEAERLAKLAAIERQRSEIIKLLDQRLTSTEDAEELQKLLDEVNSFAIRLEE